MTNEGTPRSKCAARGTGSGRGLAARGAALLLAAQVAAGAAGCATDGAPADVPMPRMGGDPTALEGVDAAELRRLGRIATDLVSALVQFPALRPTGATLHLNPPANAFGHALVRALEDAGYGLRTVDGDGGRHYVGYARRVSETETGEVLDFRLSVGPVTLTREYAVDGEAIFPTSLLRVGGVERVPDIELAAELFAGQGGPPRSFVSGTRGVGGTTGEPRVGTVEVSGDAALRPEAAAPGRAVLDDALARAALAADADGAPPPAAQDPLRREVLILDGDGTGVLGAANKSAVRATADDLAPGDVLVIRACHGFVDHDGTAARRALRIEEELVGLGVDPSTARIAPCAGATYPDRNGAASATVELLHHRPGRAPADDGATAGRSAS